MSVLFRHVRNIEAFNQLSPKGGLTVAVEGMSTELFHKSFQNMFNKEFTAELKVGFAVCSDEDSFVKKTGRDLATSRLSKVLVKPIAVVKNELMFLIVGSNRILSFALTPRNNVILTQLLVDN